MADATSYRPDLLKLDPGSYYYELTGPSIANGVMKGNGLVVYKWCVDYIGEFPFDWIQGYLTTEIIEILQNNKWPGAKGVVFYFTISEPGVTTYGELYFDIAAKTSRQVLYHLWNKEVRESKYTTIDELVASTNWMPSKFKTEGQEGISQVSLVTYKRFDEEYDG